MYVNFSNPDTAANGTAATVTTDEQALHNPDIGKSALYHRELNTIIIGSAISSEQAKVKSQVDEFQKRFNCIKFATIQCLLMCQIAVSQMPFWLTEIQALSQHKIFLEENLDTFAKCETHYLLFGKLNFYWNYFAYDLLYQLIKVLTYTHEVFKPIYDDIVAYKIGVEEFKKCTLMRVFCEVQLEPLSGKNDPPPGFKAMVVQFKWAKDVTLEEVERFRRRYATSYNLNECAMMVNSIRPGSFTVTWFVPVSTIEILTERMDVDLFVEFNTLVIDGTCVYVSPVLLAHSSVAPPLTQMVSCYNFSVSSLKQTKWWPACKRAEWCGM